MILELFATASLLSAAPIVTPAATIDVPTLTVSSELYLTVSENRLRVLNPSPLPMLLRWSDQEGRIRTTTVIPALGSFDQVFARGFLDGLALEVIEATERKPESSGVLELQRFLDAEAGSVFGIDPSQESPVRQLERPELDPFENSGSTSKALPPNPGPTHVPARPPSVKPKGDSPPKVRPGIPPPV